MTTANHITNTTSVPAEKASGTDFFGRRTARWVVAGAIGVAAAFGAVTMTTETATKSVTSSYELPSLDEVDQIQNQASATAPYAVPNLAEVDLIRNQASATAPYAVPDLAEVDMIQNQASATASYAVPDLAEIDMIRAGSSNPSTSVSAPWELPECNTSAPC